MTPPTATRRTRRTTTAVRDASARSGRERAHARARHATDEPTPLRPRRTRRPLARRRVLVATAVLAVPALLATAVLILHTSLFAVRSVRVLGATETSRAAVLGAAGVASHPPLIDVNPVAATARVEALPWVKTARVERHWPRALTIVVTERIPAVEVHLGGTRWELFDASGRALAVRDHPVTGLVALAPSGATPAPGATAAGHLADELAIARELPTSMLHDVVLVADDRRGLVVDLSGGAHAVFGAPTAIRAKVVALHTLLANSVPLGATSVVDLRVPSSPIVSMG